MGSASDYLENNLINHIFRTSSYSKPTHLYVALYTSNPSDSGGGTEVSMTGYSRVQRDPLDTNWAATSGTDGTTSNSAVLDFGTWSSGGPVTVTGWAILDASSSGNFIVWGSLTSSKTINNGDAFQIPANNLSVTID